MKQHKGKIQMENKKLISLFQQEDFQAFYDLETIAFSTDTIENDDKIITGYDALLWFVANFNGGRVYIPSPKSFPNPIIRFIQANRNLTTRQVAAAIGISEGKIRMLQKEMKK